MPGNPFFTVIMATHCRGNLLRRALQSLQVQAFQDFEVILVADALDTETAVVATECLRAQDTFVKRPGEPGPALSRNLALGMAQGQWVVFLDDDDTFLPHHLQVLHQQASAATAHILFTDCEVVTEDRTQASLAPLSRQTLSLIGNDVNALWLRNFIPNHALAYRRSTLGGARFDEHLASLEDWDFLLLACRQGMPVPYAGGGVVMHKDYVNPGMRRGTQETSSNSFVILDFLHIYRRSPAPTAEIKAQRKALLTGVGLPLPEEWF